MENSFFDGSKLKTQIWTKLKLWQTTKTQILTIDKKSNGSDSTSKTLNVTKLKLLQNYVCQNTKSLGLAQLDTKIIDYMFFFVFFFLQKSACFKSRYCKYIVFKCLVKFVRDTCWDWRSNPKPDCWVMAFWFLNVMARNLQCCQNVITPKTGNLVKCNPCLVV